jgi:DNA repair ATPase RecN
MKTISRIKELQSQIAAKEAEVRELSDSVRMLTNPPKYEPAPGQLPFFEQVRSLMAQSKSQEEATQALESAKTVLNTAISDLETLEEQLGSLLEQQEFDASVQQIERIAEDYNAAVKKLLTVSGCLKVATFKHSLILHRQKKALPAPIQDLQNLLPFLFTQPGGRTYQKRLNQMSYQERSQLGLEDF